MRTVAAVVLGMFMLSVVAHAADRTLAEAIRPISNPVYFDSPNVGALVHPIFLHQAHPDRVSVDHPALGKTQLPAGGDFQVYALQFEIPLQEDLSLIAVKDGYIDFNPDATFSKEEGIADLAAGLKWVFKEADTSLFSTRLVYEAPIGDDEVWQGNGDGTVNLGLSGMSMQGHLFVAGTGGVIVPIDDEEESTSAYTSWHVSGCLYDRLFPLVELNYFRVLSEGDGVSQFTSQVDGAVPAVARFEGGDLINLGAVHADDNPDFVTVAVGCRVRAASQVDVGAAYEFPLTDKEDSLMDYRVSVDAVYRF